RVAEEPEMLKHLHASLESALTGILTDEAFDRELREYWLSGSIGRAYVLGSDLFGAIYIAFGKDGVFRAMRDPRLILTMYNDALDAKPEALAKCVHAARHFL
ncbi:MAG TPA: hypothetical protein VJZ00_22850, partial [Thermoanaerobaculia bacterium]|nr:hypothetical protein [Thermoanaerobaculia bacterium]